MSTVHVPYTESPRGTVWQDCFVISFSCKLNRSDEREPHDGDSLSCYLYLFGLSLLRTLQQHDMLHMMRMGKHIDSASSHRPVLTLSRKKR